MQKKRGLRVLDPGVVEAAEHLPEDGEPVLPIRHAHVHALEGGSVPGGGTVLPIPEVVPGRAARGPDSESPASGIASLLGRTVPRWYEGDVPCKFVKL